MGAFVGLGVGEKLGESVGIAVGVSVSITCQKRSIREDNKRLAQYFCSQCSIDRMVITS